jgi:hypothetical protein
MEGSPQAKQVDLGRAGHLHPVKLMSPAGEVRRTPGSSLAARLLEAAAKATRGERALVRIGRRRVAIVEKLEDEEDLRDVRASRAETKRRGTIPWNQVKASLGLDKGDHEPPAHPERTMKESALDEIRVFHDAEARTLTVWFGRPEEERDREEVGEGVVLINDGDGVVIGFETLGFVAEPESLRLVLEKGWGAGDGTPSKATECAQRAVPARGRPLRLEEDGRGVGFLISDEDFALFRRLLDAEEDRLDVAAARQALREVGSVSLEELVDELGL